VSGWYGGSLALPATPGRSEGKGLLMDAPMALMLLAILAMLGLLALFIRR
jgi:hypothetical protein